MNLCTNQLSLNTFYIYEYLTLFSILGHFKSVKSEYSDILAKFITHLGYPHSCKSDKMSLFGPAAGPQAPINAKNYKVDLHRSVPR